MFKKLKEVDFGTLVRTILQFLVYVNQIVAFLGRTTFADSVVYQWISLLLTIVITALTYWFNNDWTSRALLSRDFYDMLKDGKITKEEAEEFIKKYEQEKKEGK